MITIRNTQRKIKIDTKHVEKTAQQILNELGYSDFDLGIWFTTNKTVRTYNRDYRKKDRATDILSFPYHQLEAGKRPKITCDEDKNIGDIIISPEYVQEVLVLYKVPFKERLTTLLIHGVCHLLGYTHYDDENDIKMRRVEKKLAKKLAA